MHPELPGVQGMAAIAELPATMQRLVAEAEKRLHVALEKQLEGMAEAQEHAIAAAQRKAEAAERAAGRLKTELRGAVGSLQQRLQDLEAVVEAAMARPAGGSGAGSGSVMLNLTERLAALETEVPEVRTVAQTSASQSKQMGDLSTDVQRLDSHLQDLRERIIALADKQTQAVGEAAAAQEAATDDALSLILARVAETEERAAERMDGLEARMSALEQRRRWQLPHDEVEPSSSLAPAAALPTVPSTLATPVAAQAAVAAFAAFLGDSGSMECATMAPSASDATPHARAPQMSMLGDEETAAAGGGGVGSQSAAVALSQLDARLTALEEEVHNQQAPVDGLTADALEARIGILEDDYLERQRQADAQEAEAAVAAPSAVQSTAAAAAADQQQRQPSQEALSVVDAFGEHLEALLTRFGPEANSSQPAAGSAAEGATGALVANFQGQLASLSARVTAIEAAVHDGSAASASSGPAHLLYRVEEVECVVAGLRSEHKTAVVASAEHAADSELELEQLRSRLEDLALRVAAEAEAAQARGAGDQGEEALQQLAQRIQSLELEVAALAEATARAATHAAEAAAAAGGSASKAASDAAANAQEAAAKAAEAVAAVGAKMGDLQGDVNELSSQLYELRVEMQNGQQDLGGQLEGLKSDMEISQSGQRAAAERAEQAAAEALEKVEELSVAVSAAPAAAVSAVEEAIGAVRASAEGAIAEAAAVEASITQLQQQVASLNAQAQQLQQQNEVVGSDSAQASASAGATAELTLRLQATAAETAVRLESLVEQLASTRTALDAQATKISAVESAAAAAASQDAAEEIRHAAEAAQSQAKAASERLEEIQQSLAAVTDRFDKAMEEAAAAQKAAAAAAPVTNQWTPAGASEAGAAALSGPRALPRHLINANRTTLSTDSLDSPSFAGAIRGPVTYPATGASPGASANPSRSASGAGSSSLIKRSYDNSLFGMDDPNADGNAAAIGAVGGTDTPAAARISSGGLPSDVLQQQRDSPVRLLQGDAPLSVYSNEAFEHDAGHAEQPDESAQRSAADPGSAAADDDGVRRALFSEVVVRGSRQDPGSGPAAAQEEQQQLQQQQLQQQQLHQQQQHQHQHQQQPPAGSMPDSSSKPSEKAGGFLELLRPSTDSGEFIPAFRPDEQQQHAEADSPADDEREAKAAQPRATASPASVAEAIALLSSSFGPFATTNTNTAISSLGGRHQPGPRGGRGGRTAGGPDSAAGRSSIPDDSASCRRCGHAKPVAALPPAAAAAQDAPAAIALRHAEQEEKGPSEIDLAKQELQRAATASPGRVRRQAMATESMIAAIVAGSDSDTGGSPLRTSTGGMGSAGGSPARRPAPAAKRKQQPSAGGAVSPLLLDEPQKHSAAGDAAVQQSSVVARTPSPYGLIDLSGSEAESDSLIPLPGLEKPHTVSKKKVAGPSPPPPPPSARITSEFGSTQLEEEQGGAMRSAATAAAPGATSGNEDGGYMVRVVDRDEVLRLRGGAYAGERYEETWEEEERNARYGSSSSPFASSAAAAAGRLAGAGAGAGAAPESPNSSGARVKRRLLGGFYGGTDDSTADAPGDTANGTTTSSAARHTTAQPPVTRQPPADDEQPPSASKAVDALGARSYRVVVFTSSRHGAGTDGLVTLILRTASGAKIELPLNTQRGVFVDGSQLEFMVEACDGCSNGGGGAASPAAAATTTAAAAATAKIMPGGDVVVVTVLHDGKGYANAWLLDKVLVQELETGGY